MPPPQLPLLLLLLILMCRFTPPPPGNRDQTACSFNPTPCSVDVFFLDWEKPRRVLAKGGAREEAAPVSAWRGLLVANEWNELQAARATRPALTLLAVAALLDGAGFATAGYLAPDAAGYAARPGVASSMLLRFGVAAGWFLVLGAAQWLWRAGVASRVAGEPLGNFVDLLFLANSSAVVLDERTGGYYLHGRNQMHHAGGVLGAPGSRGEGQQLFRGVSGSPVCTPQSAHSSTVGASLARDQPVKVQAKHAKPLLHRDLPPKAHRPVDPEATAIVTPAPPDTTLSELNAALLREEEGLVSRRGLVTTYAGAGAAALNDNQTFTLLITPELRRLYESTLLAQVEQVGFARVLGGRARRVYVHTHCAGDCLGAPAFAFELPLRAMWSAPAA